jgi:hypothetical protein
MVVLGADGPPVGTSSDEVELKRAGYDLDYDPANVDQAVRKIDAVLGNSDRTIGAD